MRLFRSQAFWQGFWEGLASLPNFFADIYRPDRHAEEYSLQAAWGEVQECLREAMNDWGDTHGPATTRAGRLHVVNA